MRHFGQRRPFDGMPSSRDDKDTWSPMDDDTGDTDLSFTVASLESWVNSSRRAFSIAAYRLRGRRSREGNGVDTDGERDIRRIASVRDQAPRIDTSLQTAELQRANNKAQSGMDNNQSMALRKILAKEEKDQVRTKRFFSHSRTTRRHGFSDIPSTTTRRRKLKA